MWNEQMDIDQQLTRYFHAETPNPWPGCPIPRRRRFMTKITHRIVRYAIAASLAALLVGYLSLAHFFPREAPAQLENQGMISKKLDARPVFPR